MIISDLFFCSKHDYFIVHMVCLNCFKSCIMALKTLDEITWFHGGEFQKMYQQGIKYGANGARFPTFFFTLELVMSILIKSKYFLTGKRQYLGSLLEILHVYCIHLWIFFLIKVRERPISWAIRWKTSITS